MFKPKRMTWDGHVARMGKRGMYALFWWESLKERDHQENLDIVGRIIIKWILDRLGRYGLDLSGSGQEPVEGCCEHGNKLSGSVKCCEFLEWLSDWRLP
jgi:hypothetical protein